MNANLDAPALPPPDPPPEALGLVCPGCKGTAFKTSWQVFRDGTKHARMSCAACRKFIRYLKQHPDAPAYRLERRSPDAPAYKTTPPPDGWQWVGYLRQDDNIWRPIALCSTLAGCWDAMLSLTCEGDRLAAPSMPAPRES
jgi:hypothetical protein